MKARTSPSDVSAAQQIDAILSPAESTAVLGERTKMREAMRAAHPEGAPGPNGGPGPNGAPPNGMHRGGHKSTAGAFLLQLGVSREKMRELHQSQMQGQQPH